MHFEPTIRIGDLITIASLGVAVWNLAGLIREMKWKTDMIWRWYAKEHGIDNGGKK